MNVEFAWSLLIHSAVYTTLILLVGTIALRCLKQPAEQLALIPWIMAACLVTPVLSSISAWKFVSLGLLPPVTETSNRQVPDATPVVIHQKTSEIPSPNITHNQSSPAAVDSRGSDRRSPAAGQVVEVDRKVSSASTSVGASSTASPINSPATAEVGPNRGFSPTFSLIPLLVAAYLGSLLLLTLWWLIGLGRLLVLHRSARPAPQVLLEMLAELQSDKQRNIRLLTSDRVGSPITWGYFRPVILLPAEFASTSSPSALRWSLAHELSHIERRDFLTLLLATFSQIVCFYQPLYWSIRCRMTLCQDYLADARAAQTTGSSEDYAQFLVELAKTRSQPALSVALGIIDPKSQLFRRVRMLIDEEGQLTSRSRWSVLVGSVCGTLMLLASLSLFKLNAEGSTTNNDQITVASSTAPALNETETEPGELEPSVVSGTLVNAADGKPVADAVVIMHTGGNTRTKTDAQGQFRLENIKFQNRQYPLWAHRGNLVTEVVEVRHLPGSEETGGTYAPLNLQMIPGKKARFTVTSKATGKPVPGATIRFGYPDRRKLVTDPEGIAVEEGLLVKSAFTYEITVEAEGYARDETHSKISDSGDITDIKVSLEKGGIVEGVVLDEKNQPLGETGVTYFIGSGTGFYGDSYQTNNAGVFRHRYLPLNRPAQLYIRKPGYEDHRQEIVLVDAEPKLDLKIQLKKRLTGDTVNGIVTDKAGKPVPGVEASVTGQSTGEIVKAVTNEQGRFTLTDVPIRDIFGRRIYLAAAGFAPVAVPVKPSLNGQPVDMTVELEPGHTIRGIVEVEGEKSPAGTFIYAQSQAIGDSQESLVTVADDGMFEFHSLPADVRFQVSKAGHGHLLDVKLELDTKEPVKVLLPAPGRIRGRVVDNETGLPIPQFQARVSISQNRKPDDPRGSFPSDWGDPGISFSSGEGLFSVGPLLDQLACELTIECDGYDRQLIPRVVATKRTDDDSLLEIRLKKAAPAVYSGLKGVLLNHAGEPVPNAQLRLIVSSEQPTGRDDNRFNWVLIESGDLAQKSYCDQFRAGVTDSSGHFQFDEIPPGKSLQMAYWGTGVPRAKSLAFDETRPDKMQDVTIRLPHPAVVRGSLDRTKFPDAGTIKVIYGIGGFEDHEFKLEDKQETFEFNTLPPGRCTVIVYEKLVPYVENGIQFARSAPLASQKVALKPGEVVELRFDEPNENRRE